MANPEHLAKLEEGVKAWNLWRESNPGVRIDLSHSDLREAHLSGASLTGATFSEANLSGADLNRADLSGANLGGAEFIGADLRRADLRGADLRGADLSSASTGYTIFANTDLSTVKGLETIKHVGPSTIGLDTIYKSKGKIPPIFLRGCGVPDNFITFMPSLVGTGIEFYSLFISYSTHDQPFAERLHADLQAKGVRCWFAPHNMRGGKKVYEQIDEAIRVYDKLLLILSPESMASTWVQAETFRAREREIREDKRILFPISLCPYESLRSWRLIDGETGRDLAREIREYYIPDFSNWKDHDANKAAFDRLLKDLQPASKPA